MTHDPLPETERGQAMRHLKHLFLHLIPRTHRTRVGRNGREHFIVWRQWLNRVWNVDDITVA